MSKKNGRCGYTRVTLRKFEHSRLAGQSPPDWKGWTGNLGPWSSGPRGTAPAASLPGLSVALIVKLELGQDFRDTLPRMSVPKGRHRARLLLALENLGQLFTKRGSVLPNQNVRSQGHGHGTFGVVA
jgi:hypothetical protein